MSAVFMCALRECMKNSLSKDVSLFRFPNDMERCKKWTDSNGIGVLISLGHLSSSASETQRVVEMFNNLFDIFNSRALHSAKQFNRGFKGENFQIEFLKSCVDYFGNLKVFNKNKVDKTNLMKSVKCWQISINAVLGLWEVLKNEGFKFLLTRRLNQDALENYFGTVRRQGGCCVNPSPIQFSRAFKKLFCLKFLNSGTENCTDDFAQMLVHFEDFKNKPIFETEVPHVKENLPLTDCDYKYHNVEKNAIRYICGYLIRKCLALHTCEICQTFSTQHQELDETTLLCFLKAYKTKDKNTFGNLNMPENSLFIHVSELEEIFKDNFEETIFLNLYLQSHFKHPCENFPYKYFIKLYSRMRLFYSLKFINKNFKTVSRDGIKVSRKIIIWRHD